MYRFAPRHASTNSVTLLSLLAALGIWAGAGAACTTSTLPDKPTSCTVDVDCHPTMECQQNTCVLRNLFCGANQPCPESMHCCGGACSASECCQVDAECSSGYCDDGGCADGVRPGCPQSACPSGVCLVAEGTCVECLENQDCDDTFTCNTDHRCVPSGIGCTLSECALTGEICQPEEGVCRDCISTAECGDKICDGSSGKCVACSGSVSGECGIGRTCDTGRCITDSGTACTTDADCGDRICVGAEPKNCDDCILNTECGAERTCVGGRCLGDSPNCSEDQDCSPPSTICQGELCSPGCTAVTCAEGQSCSPTTGRCVITSSGTAVMGASCTIHGQCQTGVCWPVVTAGGDEQFCSRTCRDAGDCPTDFVCNELGDSNLCVHVSWFFTTPYPALDGVAGDSCDEVFYDYDCASGYCHTQNQLATAPVCMQVCQNDAQCDSLGLRCVMNWPLGTDDNGSGSLDRDEVTGFTALCHSDWGYLGPNVRCASGVDGTVYSIDHSKCQSGWCAQTPDTLETARCAEPCCSPSDCGIGNPICKPIDVWDGIRDSSAEPFGYQKICLWKEYQGTLDVGALCSNDTECKSEVCIAGVSGEKRCTHTCCTNDDCANYDWAQSCRPPFGGGTVVDSDFEDSLESLGRVGVTITGTGSVPAAGTICMPR